MLKKDLIFLKKKRDELIKKYNQLIDDNKKNTTEFKNVKKELLKINNIISRNDSS